MKQEPFWSDYPIVADYVNENYEEVGEFLWSKDFPMSVFVERRRMRVGIYEPLGLPCF